MANASSIIRPDAVVLPDGSIGHGLEVCIESGVIAEIRPYSSAARSESGMLLSPAFVNAHSHLEYYDLLGKMPHQDYWPWIREITITKPTRSFEEVQKCADLAALKNKEAGIAAIGEHSDWPVSGAAMARASLLGRIFQEVITINEWDSPIKKVEAVQDAANKNQAASGLPVNLSPHATYTVSPEVLRRLSSAGEPIAIHASETPIENEFFQHGSGSIAEMYASCGLPMPNGGQTAIEYLHSNGALRSNTQLVHCCAITDGDIELIAQTNCTVAHCPRSNENLRCPPAPIARLRKQGVRVGLGLDSAASSGEISMFEEMRAALRTSRARGETPRGGQLQTRDESLSAEDVWRMATGEAADSIFLNCDWSIRVGASPALMLIRPTGKTLSEIIENCNNESIVPLPLWESDCERSELG